MVLEEQHFHLAKDFIKSDFPHFLLNISRKPSQLYKVLPCQYHELLPEWGSVRETLQPSGEPVGPVHLL